MMRTRRSGTLLYVGSVGVYYDSPTAAPYVGSKALLEGLVTNLATEVAPFGLRTSILTFGHFRTEVLHPSNIKLRAPNKVSDYAEINDQVKKQLAKNHGAWPGDVKKACDLIVDAVRGEGSCANKELPLRLPIGSDTFGLMRNDLLRRLQVCDEWEAIMSKTNL